MLVAEAAFGQTGRSNLYRTVVGAPVVGISEYALPTAKSLPGAISAGPDGNLWFTEGSNTRIGKITPAGVITEYALPAFAGVSKTITPGGDGNVWFAEAGLHKIAKITPTGSLTEYDLPPDYAFPEGVTLGPDGNVWLTLQSKVAKITSNGAMTGYSTGALQPDVITRGSDGNLWFTDYVRNGIGRITTAGTATAYTLPVQNSWPQGITAGPDGNVWFTEQRGVIGKITVDGVITEYAVPEGPMGITVGSDGALWFCEYDTGKIGRITTDGAISEYPIPTYHSYPYSITTGPDGNIWFTETNGGKIGKIILSNPVSTGPVTLSALSLEFSAGYGPSASPPAPQTFSVTAPATTSFTVAVDGGGSWLSVTPSGLLNTNQTITVSAKQDGLSAGIYRASISVGAAGTTQKVYVALNVAPTTGGSVYTRPGSLQTQYSLGGNAPALMELDILSDPSSVPNNSFTISAATVSPSGANWLFLADEYGSTIANGSTWNTPLAMRVKVNPSGLGQGSWDGFITINPSAGTTVQVPVSLRVIDPAANPPVVQAVANAASFDRGAISPGEIVTIGGTGLGPASPLNGMLDSSGKVGTTVAGTAVLMNGIAAPLTYVSATQINCIVPYELARASSVTVQVKFVGQESNSYAVATTAVAPRIFTLDGSGRGRGAILSEGGINGTDNPAARGSTVTIFLTGEGQTIPAGVTGKITAISSDPNGPLTPQPLAPPVVTIGGVAATVSFYGEAPGLASGVLQINAVVPAGVPSGDLPLVVSIAGAKSQDGVSISVR